MSLVKCNNCATEYHRPRKQEEIKAGYPNCPSCGKPGPACHLMGKMFKEQEYSWKLPSKNL